MTPPARAFMASGTPWLARLLSLVFLLLAGFALPQQAAAQSDDDATVSIANASVVENGGNAEFTVSLSTAADSDVTLAVAYAAGTATLAADLGARPTTVTIEDGALSATLLVPIANDTIVEGNEDFTVTISEGIIPLPEGVTIGTPNTATGTIIDNDAALLGFAGRSSFVEEEGTTVTLPVSFLSSGASSAAVPVTLAWAAVPARFPGREPGQPEEDLDPSRGTVTIPAGQSSADITMTLVDDTDIEPTEYFFIQLGLSAANPLPPGVSLVDPWHVSYQRRGAIIDNDAPPPRPENARVSIADMTAAEDAGAIGFAVSLSRAVDSPVVLDVTYADGTAEVATDLGTPLPPTVTIAADTTEATIAVPIVDDDRVEGAETFTVTVSENRDTPLPDGVRIADPEATGTITDNDTAQSPALVSIAATTVSAAEGQTVAFAVRLSRAVDAPMTVRWTAAGGTATLRGPSSDLAAGAATTGTVAFAAGDTAAKRFAIATRADDLIEGNETLEVRIAAVGRLPDGVAISPTANVSRATITDTILNDNVETELSIDDASVTEGGMLRFGYTLSAAVNSTVSFYYATADGTATVADADYTPQPAGRVTVAAQATAGVLEVPTTADELVEADETLTVRLTGVRRADGGLVTLLDAVVTGTIENDDVGVVSVAPAAVVVAEGETAGFAVRLDRAVAAAVTVRWTVAGTGSRPATVTGAASDLAAGVATSGTVTFAAGAPGTTPVVLPTRADDQVEGDETFAVTLTAAEVPPGVELAPAPGLGTITDLTSVLLAPRLTGAATALRRHVGHFERLTSGLVQGRLAGRARQRMNLTPTGTGGLALGRGPATGVGVWADGAYAGFHSLATGRQVELYGGVDYAGGGGRWLLGALAGREFADLDLADGGRYRAHFTEVGPYGGVRLSERLVFDGAAAYGVATPVIRQGAVSASYAATRLTLRGGLTGDVGLTYGEAGRRVTIMPQLAVSWARERVGGFTDSAGRRARRATLALGRVSAGPRVTWERGGSQLVGGARVQWDFVQPDGRTSPLSAVVEGELRLALTPGLAVGLSGDIDGLGGREEFLTVGGGVDLRFTLTPANTLGLSGTVDGLGARGGPGTRAPNYGMRFEWRIGSGGGAGPVFPGGGHPGAFGQGGGPAGAFGPGGGPAGAFGSGGGRPGARGQTSRGQPVGPVPPAGR